jgi:hypothetical protein
VIPDLWGSTDGLVGIAAALAAAFCFGCAVGHHFGHNREGKKRPIPDSKLPPPRTWRMRRARR